MVLDKSKGVRTWAAIALAIAVVVAGAQWLDVDGDAEAHQPDGLRVSQSEMPEPPCPYGHDDGCDPGAPAVSSLGQQWPDDPHAPLPNAAAIHRHHHQPLGSLARLQQKMRTRPVQSGNDLRADDGATGDPGSGASYAITAEIANLPWAKDRQTPAEKLTLEWLGWLQELNPTLVSALTQMPFLQDHTPGDLQAIQTLADISEENPEYATAIASHAGFADDGGIDNTEAKIIAVMSMPYANGEDDLIRWLPDYGTIEEQTVSGVDFAVVRLITSLQDSALMAAATTATQDAETLMRQPLPTDFVGILVWDLSGAAGANNSIHIQVESEADGYNYTDRMRQHLVGHEIAHYWWGTGPGASHEAWIFEGAAEYIGAYTVWSRFDENDVYAENDPCPYYRTIEHLRADSPEYGSYGAECNYSLGARLFMNLDRSATAATFETAFRKLYQRLSTYDQDGIDQGLSLWRAFCPQCLQGNRDLGSTGNTLARRYGEKILTDAGTSTGAIAGLGSASSVSIRDYGQYNAQYGIAEVPASSPDQRRWLKVSFNDVAKPPETVRVEVRQFHENRYPHHARWQEQRVYSANDGRAWFHVFLGEPTRRAIGHHWVYVSNEDLQKVAEAEYQVLP